MFDEIKEELESANCQLVAVSKTKPNEQILGFYNRGQRIFGENRVKEMVGKFEFLPKDIKWHFIGTLQRKQVKHILPFVALIHSVDSVLLLVEINKRAGLIGKKINILLQLKIASEEKKQGFSFEELIELLQHKNQFTNINFCGLMGMATFTNDNKVISSEFKFLQNSFIKIKNSFFENETQFKEISSGMSGDYKLAIKFGSTLVRIGSLLFGERNSINVN